MIYRLYPDNCSTMSKASARHQIVVMVVHLLCLITVSSQIIQPKSKPGRAPNTTTASVVELQVLDDQVVLNNGILRIFLTKPGGDVKGIRYNGIDNLLEVQNEGDNRGYWDVVWNRPGEQDSIDRLNSGTTFKIISQTEDLVELSFLRRWNIASRPNFAPLIIDKRYIMRRGSSGFYTYAIFKRLQGWPDFDLDQVRIVFKLNGQRFHYMAISDWRQRVMPAAEDRARGKPLAYKEAVRVRSASSSSMNGEVDDKYQYSSEYMLDKVHGWICDNDPKVGFWMITPSNEFRSGGPLKQDLTGHVGPTLLNMFMSAHYGGNALITNFRNGEPWSKVFGPVFVYLNKIRPVEDIQKLWRDAKNQMLKESRSWPYDFVQSEDFPCASERGVVYGQLHVNDRYMHTSPFPVGTAYVGLAAPGDVGSWQKETKGYQYWNYVNHKGFFMIKNIRAGTYYLYGWVPGIIGDYKHDTLITITPGCKINLGKLIYYPPRSGPTLWEIGIPDRTAAEFYVPQPLPSLVNKLYTKHDRFRQYGLWARYADLYPHNDLIYVVGVSNYQRDWFFAHVPRNVGPGMFSPVTWQIKFELHNVSQKGMYKLQLALASASQAEIEVRINDQGIKHPHLSTGRIGGDNAIARHGIHGLYWYFGFDVPGVFLRDGNNTIFLTQSKTENPFQGVMYDYLRLEGPPAM